ncbi:MAG: protease complex subunit PrcB family protein [Chloroflexi bacterium]|nr:protease complex subunit PrcB family protein [Chloroflexota bacterium]
MKKLACFILLFLTAFYPLAACQTHTMPPLQPGEVNVPFETIAHDQWGVDKNLSNREPRLFLLSTQGDLAQVKDLIDQKVMNQLEQVDFQQYVIVALFRGMKPSSNYQTMITRMTKKNDELMIYAALYEPNTAYGSATALTSPYHIVRVARNNINVAKAKLVLQSVLLTPTSQEETAWNQ